MMEITRWDMSIKLFTSFALLLGYTNAGFIMVRDLPTKHYVQKGDLMLGGVFPVHRYSPIEFCDTKVRELGILQRVEAMVYAINEINARNDILPNVTLGFAIFDGCYKVVTSLAQALNFARIANFTCDRCCGVLALIPPNITRPQYDVIGVIGSEGSTNSVQIARLMTLFQTPQLSYASSSDILKDKVRYPHFRRIIPTDTYQASVIADLLMHFGWTYVSVIYAEGNYGTEGFRSLEKEIYLRGICFAVTREIRQSYIDTEIDIVVDEIMSAYRANVVVMIATITTAKSVLEAARRRGATNITWIASDAWGRNIQDLFGFEEDASGGLIINFKSTNVQRFDRFFESLTPGSTLNPWFDEFWQQEFGCTLGVDRNCKKNQRFSRLPNYRPERTESLVMDSVYTFAYAVQNLRNEHCPNATGDELRRCISDNNLADDIIRVNFVGETGDISFNDIGDGRLSYEIHNVQKRGDKYELVPVAWWCTLNESLIFYDETIQWKNNSLTPPKSVCSDPCPPHHQQILNRHNLCCFECEKCLHFQRTEMKVGFQRCISCPEQTLPDSHNQTTCVALIPTYLEWKNGMAIVLSTLAGLGVISTLVVLVLFYKNRNEHIVKASSKELSYTMLLGIFMSYISVYFLIAVPSPEKCLVTVYGFHISLTFIFGALATKTNRIYRIFSAGKRTARRPGMIDSRSQLVIAMVIILIHLVIITAFVAARFPRVVQYLSGPNTLESYCDITIPGFATSLIFNVLLVGASSFYAVKTRRLPDNYNESRFITFCVYTTLVMWIILIPSFFTTAQSANQTIILCVGSIVSPTGVLVCLFLPKLFAVYYVKTENQAKATTANSLLAVPSPRPNIRCCRNKSVSEISSTVQVQDVPPKNLSSKSVNFATAEQMNNRANTSWTTTRNNLEKNQM